MLNRKTDENKIINSKEQIETTEKQNSINSIEKVKERNEFYTVMACVNKYLNYLYAKDINSLYGCLDKSYIEQNNITTNNILQKIKELDNSKIFKPQEMYKQKITENVTQYFAHGIIIDDLIEEQEEVKKEDFYVSIKIDSSLETFSVLPDIYINQ